MKELTSINIVCLGNWNRRIFTPSWVASNLFETENYTYSRILKRYDTVPPNIDERKKITG